MVFTEKQKNVIKHTRNENFAFLSEGAIRSGKTYASIYAFFLYTQSLKEEYLHIIAGRNLRVLENEIVSEIEDLGRAFGVTCNYRRIDGTLQIGNQSYVVVAGHDTNSEKRVQGLTIHSVIIDEATLVPKTFFEQIIGRQTYDGSKLWVTCNPSSPYHWLKKEWIDTGKIEQVEKFRFDDNPTLGDKVKERNDSLFSGVFHKRMVLGEWAAADGVIWPYYSHEDVAFTSADIRHIDIGIDYGIQSITAMTKMATLKDGRMVVLESYHYDGKKRVKNDIDLADDLMDFVGQDAIRFVFIDPSASSYIETIKRLKGRTFRVRKADNAVLPGIRVTMNLFEKDRLIISKHRSNQPLIEELSLYSWDDKNEDKPIKENDHHCDSLRYVVYTLNKKFYPSNKIRLPRNL